MISAMMYNMMDFRSMLGGGTVFQCQCTHIHQRKKRVWSCSYCYSLGRLVAIAESLESQSSVYPTHEQFRRLFLLVIEKHPCCFI